MDRPYNTASYKHLVVTPGLPRLLSPLAPFRPPPLTSAITALRGHARGADEARHDDLLRQLGLAPLALFLDEIDLEGGNEVSFMLFFSEGKSMGSANLLG